MPLNITNSVVDAASTSNTTTTAGILPHHYKELEGEEEDCPPSLTAPESHSIEYMKRHHIPLLTEALLMATVPVNHPHPVEAVSQALLINAPVSQAAAAGTAATRQSKSISELVESEVNNVLTWMRSPRSVLSSGTAASPPATTLAREEAVVRLGGAAAASTSPSHEEITATVRINRAYWLAMLATLQFDVFAFDATKGPELPAFVLWMFEDLCGPSGLGWAADYDSSSCAVPRPSPPYAATATTSGSHKEEHEGDDIVVFLRWVVMVRANYHRENPFHNFRHAFNVLQTLYSFLKTTKELFIGVVGDETSSNNNTAQVVSSSGGSGTTDAHQQPSSSSSSSALLVFSETERFALLFAALCHDLQHCGVNNQFLVDTMHPLALRYGDSAVLERHHAAVAFATLEYRPLPFVRTAPPDLRVAPQIHHPSGNFCDITAHLPRRWGLVGNNEGGRGTAAKQQQRVTIGSQASVDAHNADFPTFRSLVLKCIMGTEVASHGQHVDNVKRHVVTPLLIHTSSQQSTTTTTQQSPGRDAAATAATTTTAAEVVSVEEKLLLSNLLLRDAAARHAVMIALVEAADISNEIRSFDQFSKRWAPLVVEEFCRQGDVMQHLGWQKDIPPMFRRGVAHPAKDQPGFIQYLCLPLYRTLAIVMPSTFATCVANLESNLASWASGKW